MRFEYFFALRRPYELNELEKKSIDDMLYLLQGDDRVKQRTTVQGLLTRLENKSGVLLTHISMMVAVTGVLLGIQATGTELNLVSLNQTLLEWDFVLYLLLALLCVRCQFHMDSGHSNQLNLKTIDDVPEDKRHTQTLRNLRDKNRDTLDDVFRGEVYYRERLFKLCFYGLFIVTLSLVVAMILSIFEIDAMKTIQSIWAYVSQCIWGN